jgi:hypothetical protein
MSYWEKTRQEIGLCVPGTKRRVEFKALANIPPIKNIIAGCGCTDYKYDIQTGILLIVYNVGEVPMHLDTSVGMSKHFKIEYVEGNSESLSFSGTILKSGR